MLPSLARLDLPQLVTGIERVRHGPDELMIRSPRPLGAAAYLRLEPADERLLELMDGTRTSAEIVVENFGRGGGLSFTRLSRLLQALSLGGFLVQQKLDVYATLAMRLRGDQRPRLLSRLRSNPLDLLQIDVWKWRRADRFLASLHQRCGWVLFQSWFVIVATVAALIGFGFLVNEMLGERYALFTTAHSYLLGFITLAVIDVIVIGTHEMAHGLAVKHARREVLRAGLLLYFLMPAPYVDSTDIWMAKRRHRVIVSWAGPFSGMLIGGFAGFIAAFPPSRGVGEFAFKLGTISFITSLLNLIPLLELDGYFILVDLLNMPLLRSRAIQFSTRELPRRLRHGFRGAGKLGREEWFLALFGLSSIAFSVLAVGSGILFYRRRLGPPLTSLWAQPDWWARPLVVLLISVVALPIAISVLTAGRAVVQRPMSLALGVVRRRLPGSVVGTLQRTSVFGGMSLEDIETIAGHARRRRVGTGALLVREGDPGDEFFIITSGSAEARVQGREWATELGPGDFFGEVALLERVPRTATVAATTAMELVVLDAGHFRRWLSGQAEVRAQISERLAEWDRLASLPLFAGVGRADLDALLREAESVRYDAGKVIVAEGDEGDAMYIIAEGGVEVTQRGAHVRDLGPGDYFGELALLRQAPRSATVTATSRVRAYRLPKSGFDRLLIAGGREPVVAGTRRYPDIAGA